MKINKLGISGVSILECSEFQDGRGSFARLFCDIELEKVLCNRKIVQINHSHTKLQGTIRGMHFQYPPAAEMKIIFCIKGSVYDVAVDLREKSATRYKWHAEVLTAADSKAFIIPEGCAHGFQTLEADTELLYLHTNYYKKDCEGAVKYNDPVLAIDWPGDITCVSDRDASHTAIDSNFKGIRI